MGGGEVKVGLMETSGTRKQRLWENNFTVTPKNYTQ